SSQSCFLFFSYTSLLRSWAILATIAVFALLTLLPGAPLRNTETGSILADSPLMNGLIVFVTILFLAAGWAYGFGAGTMRSTVDADRKSTRLNSSHVKISY